jgi:hypothetical protein
MGTVEEKAHEYAQRTGWGAGKRIAKGFAAGYEAAFEWNDIKDVPDCGVCGISDNVLLKIEVFNCLHGNKYRCCIEAFYGEDEEEWHFMLPLDDKNLRVTPLAWREIEMRKDT